ncbi:MAG: hypothetical protein HKN82_02750 [Akkermansiaceae bacterium]|nr:hypothetical protein [Akkermansiaceae bacterium]
MNIFKSIAIIGTWMLASPAVVGAGSPPAVLGKYLKPDVMTKGEVVVVVPPREIGEYVAKVEENARKNPEWFREYSKTARPGIPLPYHENLGLSKDDYAQYLKLWSQRETRVLPNGNVVIRLEEPKTGEWMVRVSGRGSPISLLRYIAEKDIMQSPNGAMKRIEEIDADPKSILGSWKGHEWKFEEESSLGKTKENFAIGKTSDGKRGIIVYRLQEVSSTGRRLYDKSLVIRFALAVN